MGYKFRVEGSEFRIRVKGLGLRHEKKDSEFRV
jgi:hypothetical protein